MIQNITKIKTNRYKPINKNNNKQNRTNQTNKNITYLTVKNSLYYLF